ncbi:MAG: spore germination protein [Clostridia bacterium]|nr:spore germination protein [Clostridia bacterium]
MRKKKTLFQNLLSYITYKEKEPIKEFYIPEINEKESSQDQGNIPDHTNKGHERNRGIIKPVPVAEMRKEKTAGQNQASDNTVSTNIQQNMDYINQKFNAPDNKDIIIRQFTIAKRYKAFIAYLDGMVDRVTINHFILAALMENDDKFTNGDESCQLEFILLNVLQTNQAKKLDTPRDVIYEILSGNTVLYVDGCDYYLVNETKGYDKRGVETPQVEGVVLGSQEAFNETLRTNITLIRKYIKNSNLTTEFIRVGIENQQLCAVLSINGLTNPAIVDEVKRRIKSIKSDAILGDGMLEQFIEDNPFSLVPTMLTTERPDRTASHLLEGKVAILVEGAPFCKIVPISLVSLIHSPEDAFMRWPYGTLLRFVRVFAIAISTLLPGLYVALTKFHQEMVPTDLLIAIAKAKENVPFPTVVEVILMELSFELIREAGIRIPGIIGNTLGIIGALILGQAAVQANIVSPVLIIVVAVTGLGNFAIPNYSLALSVRLARFFFIFLGALLGFYGITIGLALIWVSLFNIKSFGVPYFSPVAPKTSRSADLFIRYPVWNQEYRPDYVNALRKKRQTKISRKWTQQNPENNYDREESDDEGR